MLNITPPKLDCNLIGQIGPKIAELPVGLDPRRLPIIATHFFGWRSVGVVAAQVVQDLAFRRKVQRLHAKGPRLIAEMLGELAAERNLATVIDQLLDCYTAIPDEALDIASGRDFPPPPLHEVLSDISEA